MPNVLTETQVDHFHREGYLFPVRGITPQEALSYRQRIEDYEASSGEEVNKRLKIKAHLAFPWLVELARDPRIVSAVQDLIGPTFFFSDRRLSPKRCK